MLILQKAILGLIAFLILPFFLFFLLILRPYVKIKLWNIASQRIGHFSANIEMKINDMETEKENTKYICFFNAKVCNIFLKKKWEENLFIFPHQILFPIYNILQIAGKYVSWLNDHIFVDYPIFSRDFNNLIDTKKPIIKFSINENKKGIESLEKFGVKESDKFVCVIVRDDAYLKTNFPSQDWSKWSYRDYDIKKFLPAMEELTRMGYFVFRMGKLSNEKIVSENKMIIDYSFSEYKNDFLDIYLGANCEFCLTTDCGYDHIPYIFRRPIASITDPIALMKLSSKKFMNIFSNYYLKKEDRYLSLQEIFDYDVSFFDSSKKLISKGVELIQPDKDDIKNLVIDMNEYVKNNFKLQAIDEQIYKRFIKIYSEKISHENFNKVIDQITKSKQVIKLHSIYNARISPKFLKKRSFLTM